MLELPRVSPQLRSTPWGTTNSAEAFFCPEDAPLETFRSFPLCLVKVKNKKTDPHHANRPLNELVPIDCSEFLGMRRCSRWQVPGIRHLSEPGTALLLLHQKKLNRLEELLSLTLQLLALLLGLVVHPGDVVF
jgi:hypothetical protein